MRMHGDGVKRAGWGLMRGLVPALASLAALLATPRVGEAQVIAPCDFDVADDLGRFMEGGVLKLVSRPGATSTIGNFYIINGNTPESDVDKDGYATACDFTALFVANRNNLFNIANSALAIPGININIINFPNLLRSGRQAIVQVSVEVPAGTVAGRYVGTFEIRDSIRGPAFTPVNDFWNLDRVAIELEVLPEAGLAIVDPDAPETLDSVVVRGRAGTRANGVFRVANEGNTNLQDVRLSATDLRSESAVGLVIPAQNISFAAPSFANIIVGDTARVTVTVQIPRGILGGRYRGAITVQSAGGPAGQPTGAGEDALRSTQTIPLVVIVQSNRGILFANNPVRGALGDVAQIAFNGDPGTQWQLAIFDMMGLAVYRTSGTVFAGIRSGGTPGSSDDPGAGADFAVNATWPLINGRGEPVASGMYVVIVESFVNGRRQVTRDRLMVIR
jgi:hypothetical protein